MISEKYNIVFGIDNNYAQQLIACIDSLLEVSTQQHFHFFILSLEISYENKMIIQKWINEKKQEASFIDIDQNVIKNFPLKSTDYISLASYLRLFIPKFIPLNISKVLYVDSDIIFKDSVTELYNIDISNYATAAIEDAPNDNPLRLGYDPKFSYFNAGVQLLNLDYLRLIDFTKKALDYIKLNSEKLILHDQDVMNVLLHQHACFLPIKWNMLDCYYVKPYRISEKYRPDIKKYQNDAAIIHFSGPIKPWHYGCRHPLKKLYNKFAQASPIHSKVDKWGGLKIFPKRIRWMILLGLPWKFINTVNDIFSRIEGRIHIS